MPNDSCLIVYDGGGAEIDPEVFDTGDTDEARRLWMAKHRELEFPDEDLLAYPYDTREIARTTQDEIKERVMKWQVTNPETVIAHEPHAFGGTGAISLKFGGVTMRWTLEDAETIGEGLIRVVREAEVKTKINKR